MKPRLPPLPLTKEDMDILLSIGHLVQPSRKHFGDVLDAISESSDRRDAVVMLEAQCQRYCEIRLTDGLAFADRSRFPMPYLAPIRQPCGPVGGDITSCV